MALAVEGDESSLNLFYLGGISPASLVCFYDLIPMHIQPGCEFVVHHAIAPSTYVFRVLAHCTRLD
jgi:hypothetical protein